jgi:Protein of unknown function (DUF1501)
MLTLRGPRRECRRGISRRDVLKAGALGLAGLTLPEILRLQQCGASDGTTPSGGRGKSVILIWLRGGPSHIDSYDMKPNAPAEVRGEFRPTPTNVPGIEICDLMPRQATIMDQLAIIRGIKSNDLGDHTPHYILTGHPSRGVRPTIGAVTSYLGHSHPHDVPPYVSSFKYSYGEAAYTGPAHQPFIPQGAGMENLRLRKELTIDRLDNRRELLGQLDTIRREMDRTGTFDGIDTFIQQALEMVTSAKARDAFDLKQEPRETVERYGKYCESLLLARRLVEAGVSVVTLKIGDWDTHEHNFRDMREQLPQLDQGFHALVTDLHDRGLQNDVAVVLWGEFGRAPRISRIAGRDHWPEAGAAVVAGGGWRVGQVIGETDTQAARSTGKPYTPSNIFANLYRHLGIDPAATIADLSGRPMHILDDRELVRELL